MEKDQKISMKFLELFPDDLADRIFYSLDSNMVHDNDLSSFRKYLEYVRKIDFSFESKILKENHVKFYESCHYLNTFIVECFFRVDPNNDFLILHPDVKNKDIKKWKVFARNLESLLSETEKMHSIFRKSIEESMLRGDPIIKTKVITKNSKYKFPFKLTRGTKWEDFIFKFIDDENISISVGKFKHTANYKDIGFIGKGKNPKPSEAWRFLKVLAILHGELTVKDREAKDKYKKQKEILSKILEDYFTLEYDPFYPYDQLLKKRKKANSYKTKIMLIASPEMYGKTDNLKDDENEIEDYINNQCPQVYEAETD